MDKKLNKETRKLPNAKNSGISSDNQRSIAKIGMAVSMGVLVYTGLRGKEVSGLHIGSGLALIGFSFWHYRLYRPYHPRR